MQIPAAILEGSFAWNVPLICAVIGGVLLGTGILGNGIKIKEIELPKLDTVSRFIAGVVGAILLGISVWLVVIPPISKAPASAQDHKEPEPAEPSKPPEGQKSAVALKKQSSCHTTRSLQHPIKADSVRVTFSNVGATPLKGFWVDFDGNKAMPFELLAGDTLAETSYLGHQWVFEDADGKCVSTFTVPDHDADVQIGGG